MEEKRKLQSVSRVEARKILNEGPNHRGRGRTEAEKKAAYREYYRIKKELVEFEKKNLRYLTLFRSSDFGVNKKQFYIMGGNSALIYVHDIAPRIGRKRAALRTDTDNGEHKFRTGIAVVADIEKLGERLATIGIKKLRESKEGVVYFSLDRDYTLDEVKGMYAIEKENERNLNQMIYPKVVYPSIYKAILELKRHIPFVVAKINSVHREMYGKRIIDTLFDLTDTYMQMVRENMDVLEGGEKMYRLSCTLMDELSTLNELQLIDVVTLTRHISTIVGMNRQIMGEIINKEKKHDTN